MKDNKLLLNAKEAAELLSLSVTTTRRRMKDGTLPTLRIAGNIRIPVEALENYISVNQKVK